MINGPTIDPLSTVLLSSRVPSFTKVVPEYVLLVAPANCRIPVPVLVKSASPLIDPLMMKREDGAVLMVVSLPRTTFVFQLKVMACNAPLPPIPLPFKVRGSETSLVTPPMDNVAPEFTTVPLVIEPSPKSSPISNVPSLIVVSPAYEFDDIRLTC